MGKNRKVIIASLIILGICGCTAGFVFLSLKSLSSFFPPLGVADCGWDDTALAWIDDNKNGIWDSYEKPLAGVHFIGDDIQHEYDTSSESISDNKGRARVYIFPVDCHGFDKIEIIIKATPPDGYRSTTPSEIPVPKNAVKNAQNDNFLFGFIQEDP